jgi:phosphoglycolate phosphatase
VSHPSGLLMPRAVIFDWDSTLADNWGAIGQSINATLREYGKPTWNEQEVRERTKQSARDRFPVLFGDQWEAALSFFYARFEEFHVSEVKPLPGSDALLGTLNDRGVPVCVVSNKTGRYLRAEAEALGWTGYFRNIVGAADAERDKPAPDPVHLALRGTEVAAGPGVWFVGDSVADLECAHRADCVPILVRGGAITAEERAAWPPRAEFEDREALCDAFLHCAAA